MLHKEGRVMSWACINITVRIEGKQEEGKAGNLLENRMGEMDWDSRPKTTMKIRRMSWEDVRWHLMSWAPTSVHFWSLGGLCFYRAKPCSSNEILVISPAFISKTFGLTPESPSGNQVLCKTSAIPQTLKQNTYVSYLHQQTSQLQWCGLIQHGYYSVGNNSTCSRVSKTYHVCAHSSVKWLSPSSIST